MKILRVPLKRQKFNDSCFPASVDMVLRFYGDVVNEEKLASSTKLSEQDGSSDVKIGQVLLRKGYNVTTFWNGSIYQWNKEKNIARLYKKEYKKSLRLGLKKKKNATLSLMKFFIDKNIPVLAEVHASKFYGRKLDYTHMVVVTGYDKRYFYLNDPDKKLGGKKKMTLKRFGKSWKNLYSGFGRSMFVVTPKLNYNM